MLAQVSGAIYTGGPDFEEYTAFLGKIYSMYMWANPLHPDFFPDLRQMEVSLPRHCVRVWYCATLMSMCAGGGGCDDAECIQWRAGLVRQHDLGRH